MVADEYQARNKAVRQLHADSQYWLYIIVFMPLLSLLARSEARIIMVIE
jgi:hypothetical protein